MTTIAASSSRHHQPTATSPQQSPVTQRWLWVTGVAFILGAVLVNIPYSMLISSFQYPDILRQPTAKILAAFSDGGSALVLTWLAFAWTGIPLLIGILALRRILQEDGHSLAGSATTLGAIGAVAQMVGLLRWVFVVPGLAAAYAETSGPTRAAIESIFHTVHQYGGVLLGEHLGQAFTIAWLIAVSFMMFRSNIFHPWLGWMGLGAATVYSLAQFELITTVIPGFPHWEPAGLIGSMLWPVWMILIGIRLIAHSRRHSNLPAQGQMPR